jgi:hypothetical protein
MKKQPADSFTVATMNGDSEFQPHRKTVLLTMIFDYFTIFGKSRSASSSAPFSSAVLAAISVVRAVPASHRFLWQYLGRGHVSWHNFHF